MSYKLVLERRGFWDNLYAKRRRLGKKTLGVLGSGEGRSFSSKKELDALIDNITRSSKKKD
ncbi:MAG: hypothetical protein NZM05_12630 [Chloroherpetonaceae bacterium]|nr:hypothetical protein [Chloroherpetonaceae bacterium]